MINLAIFASGNGTNAQRLIEHFSANEKIKVAVVFCNRPGAGVLYRAESLYVPSEVFSRTQLYESDYVLDKLNNYRIDFIVLAGFLLMMPVRIIDSFRNKIINIHPALLPKFGGKGMFGNHVHEAVIAAGEKVSGISIHYVNEKYDEGQIIFQDHCLITADDTPETLAEKVHMLEYKWFPQIVEESVIKSFSIK